MTMTPAVNFPFLTIRRTKDAITVAAKDLHQSFHQFRDILVQCWPCDIWYDSLNNLLGLVLIDACEHHDTCSLPSLLPQWSQS